MTESDAKKEIEHSVFCNTDNFEMKISKECYKTMINALEKQVAIKPKDITPHYMDSKVYECPICKEVYTYKEKIINYCKYCGQKFLSEERIKKKYTIDFGFGTATLYTPKKSEVEERFYKLASTCFGIRKSIICCNIVKAEDVECDDYERLEFNGDAYVWNELGQRKCIAPEWMADKDWSDIE